MENAIQQGEKRTRNKIKVRNLNLENLQNSIKQKIDSKQVFFYLNRLDADKQRKKLKLII